MRALCLMVLAITLGTLGPAILLARSARADTVLAKRSFWNQDRSRIHTDVTVLHDDGRVETVRVPGGVVDGIAMVVIPLGSWPMVDFVRSESKFGGKLRWPTSCIYITPDAAGSTEVPGNEELTVLQGVFDTWEAVTDSCAYIRFTIDPPEVIETRFDGKNALKFREDRWCRPAMGGDEEECYPASVAALTTLIFVQKDGDPDDGVILDADIEFNGVNDAIGVGCETLCRTDGSPLLPVQDLANTATHEVGHLLGLDHTCWDGIGTRPIDDAGEGIPSCSPESLLSPEVRDATMYAQADPREIKKRTPEPDDIAGLCAIYPKDQDPMECRRADLGGGCCSVAASGSTTRPGSATTGWLLLGLVAGALVTARACSRIRRP